MIDLKRIPASINKYLDDNRGTIRLYIEGQTIDMAGLSEWAELRVDGPRIRKLNGYSRYDVDVDMMFTVKTLSNIYRLTEMAQVFMEKMNVIPVKSEDGNTLLGCLTLRDDADHQLEIIQWGQVQISQISAVQASVEAFYKLEV